MKRFLQLPVERKKLIPLLLVLVLLLAVWYFLLPKEDDGEVATNPAKPPVVEQKPSAIAKSEDNSAVATYQPATHKNPFKPLVATEEKSPEEEVPPSPADLPPPEPVPIEPAPEDNPVPNNPTGEIQNSEPKPNPILKGIMQDRKGFSALVELGGKSILVNPGDKLADTWRVVAITREQVILQGIAGQTKLEIGKGGG